MYLYALLLFALVLGAQEIGLHGLYYRHPLFDIVPHFLTGLGIGIFLCALFQSLFPKHDETVPIVLIVFLIMVAWKIFEAYYHVNGYPLGSTEYYLDTVKDFTVSILGGWIGAWFYYKKH